MNKFIQWIRKPKRL